MKEEMKEVKNALPDYPIPMVVKLQIAGNEIHLPPLCVPATWVDLLAFNSQGFALTVNLPAGVVFSPGSTIRMEFGEVRRDHEIPPFDPPFLTRAAKKSYGEKS